MSSCSGPALLLLESQLNLLMCYSLLLQVIESKLNIMRQPEKKKKPPSIQEVYSECLFLAYSALKFFFYGKT